MLNKLDKTLIFKIKLNIYPLMNRLLTGTVPVNNLILTETVPVYIFLLTRTIPVNNSLLTRTLISSGVVIAVTVGKNSRLGTAECFV